MPQINVDFSKTVRPMKPMHGVNNGPLTDNFTCDARPFFKEAGIPFSRLHDTEYPFGSGEFVDISCIFKYFDADVDDPASYNFALTDLYLQAIRECGTQIIYRLGVSIEHNPIKIHIWPPKDNLKWAKICEHIIMHYNEGWADGFHMDIKYWEIWCEPNHCKDKDWKLWGGTAEDFAELYATASTYLKGRFPELKFGGPAFSNPDDDFVQAMFTALTKDGRHPPMDFYSWHGYLFNIEKAVERSHMAEKVLAQYGYSDAESIYDEYNYIKTWADMSRNIPVIQGMEGAAFDAAMMAAMQSTSVQILCYYDAQMKFAGSYCGLFERSEKKRRNGGASLVEPKKSYYVFKAFNEVFKCKQQVELTSDDDRLYSVAACDGEKACLMVSSYDDVDEELEAKEVVFDLKGVEGKTATVYVLDKNYDLEQKGAFSVGKFTWQMEPYSVVLVSIE